MVSARRGQFAGQYVRADQGEPRTHAGQGRGAVGGVAEQGDPAAAPGVHADLPDRVEVEVGRVPHVLQQPVALPPVARELLGEHGLLPRDLAPVEVQERGGEVEDGLGLGVVAGAVHRDEPARGPVGVSGVVEPEPVGRGEDRAVDTEVPYELLLRPERQAAGGGVQPVRADHQVEPARRAALEGDVHAVGVLGERGDGVPEDVLGVRRGRFVEDPRQVAAQDLDVSGEQIGGQLCLRLARAVHVRHGAHAGPGPFDGVQEAHAAEDRQMGLAAEVDGVAPVAEGGRAFHDRGGEAVPGQPVGERGAGDGGAGDQYAEVLRLCGVHAGELPRQGSPRAHRALTASTTRSATFAGRPSRRSASRVSAPVPDAASAAAR